MSVQAGDILGTGGSAETWNEFTIGGGSMVTAKEQEAPVASKLRRRSGIRYGSARDKFGSPGCIPPQSFDDLTSSASRRPSPRKFSEKSVSENTAPGNSNNHGNSSICSAPSLINTPHELIGGCTPRPRKLRKDSISMTEGTVRVCLLYTSPSPRD